MQVMKKFQKYFISIVKLNKMKKEKDYTIALLIGLFIFACLCSCSYGKQIAGEIQDVSGNTVQVQGKRFIVAVDTLKIGQVVTFTSVKKNDKRINIRKSN